MARRLFGQVVARLLFGHDLLGWSWLDSFLGLSWLDSSLEKSRLDSFLGWSWLPDDYSQTGYNHVLTPNSQVPDCFDTWNDHNMGQGAMTARSRHPGGVNVVFADGSTKFVNESIDLYVWRRLGSSDGGEFVDDF